MVIMTKMKKTLGLILCSAILLCVSSCREKIQSTAGVIKKINDTVMVTKISDYLISFDIKKVKLTHGAVMPGDSIKIDYIGDLKERKAIALVVTYIPQTGHYVEAGYDPTKKLQTKSSTPKEDKELDEFLKNAKKHGH